MKHFCVYYLSKMAINFIVFNQQINEIKYIFNNRKNGVSNDCLSQKIWNFYLNNTQNYRVFDQKIRIKNKLNQTLNDYFNENGLKFVQFFISGSTANGFATINSDIDLCFIVSNFYDLALVKNKKLSILADIQSILSDSGFHLKDCQLIDARVPILRYIDSNSGIQVEINVNNEIGIRNTRLLYCYSKLDWRVVPICLAVKKWGKDNGIIDSYSGALSSYCMELMVIFYLQRLRPPILPCLQQISPHLFDGFTDIKTYTEMPDLNQLMPFESLNNKSLAHLFIGFFKYYLLKFDFTKHVASVRLGRAFDKQQIVLREDSTQWQLICIEEPFSGCNAARTVYDCKGYKKVIDGFKDMYTKSLSFIDCNCSQIS